MKIIIVALCTMDLFLPIAAQTLDASILADTVLQSGPDSRFPAVADIARGTPVSITGCVEGWVWCDVAVGTDHGWVAGTYLEEKYYAYNDQPVIVADYGPRIGIPIVNFSLKLYWERYYRSRPWFGQRHDWDARKIISTSPPRPAAALGLHSPGHGLTPIKKTPVVERPADDTIHPGTDEN